MDPQVEKLVHELFEVTTDYLPAERDRVIGTYFFASRVNYTCDAIELSLPDHYMTNGLLTENMQRPVNRIMGELNADADVGRFSFEAGMRVDEQGRHLAVLTMPYTALDYLKEQGVIQTVPQDIGGCLLADRGVTGGQSQEVASVAAPVVAGVTTAAERGIG